MPQTTRFPLIAGTVSLCLVDTVSARGRGDIERLRDDSDLADWVREAGLCALALPIADDAPVRVRRLRDAIHDCAAAAIAGAPMPAAAVAVINEAALAPPLRPQLGDMAGIARHGDPIEAVLSTIAEDAIRMFATPARIRRCESCNMLFFDASRPGRRRWCSSATGCGNRAKVRRYRARKGDEL